MKYLENIGKKIDSFFTKILAPTERNLRDLEEIYHLSDFLPYRWYDNETELFISEKQIGFVIETMPLVGNSENMQKELSNIFTQILPEESSIQTILYADKNIGRILNGYVKTRDQAIPVMKTLAKRRAEHLSQLAIKSHLHPYVLRDFKCYMSVCINLKSSLKSAIKQVKSIKTQIVATLKVVGVDSRVMNAQDLLRFLDGIFNIDFSNTEASNKRWNKFDPINEQVIDSDTDIEVKTEEDLLKVRNGEANVNLDNPLIVIELEELKEKKELQAVVVQMMVINITNKMFLGDRKTPFNIVFDEAWDMLRAKQSEVFIETLARRLRKYRGSLVVGTQSVNDFYSCAGAQAAWDNSDWNCFLSQKEESIAQLKNSKRILLDEYKERVINSVKTEQGKYAEVLINGADGYAVGKLLLDPFSGLLFSTKPEDYAAIQDLRKRGYDISAAVEQVLAMREKVA